jgi:DNA-directed RNA polymerase specialized sigma24 family protein
VSDDSTAVLQGQLERAAASPAAARQRLLELARDRLLRHARHLLHGPYARLEPFAQTDDVVQQLYLKALRNQGRFWANARGEPVQTLAEFFGHTSAWMRDVLCDLLRQACGRDDNRPAAGRRPLRRRPAARAIQQHARRGEAAALGRVPRGGGPAAGRAAGRLRPALVPGAVPGRGRRAFGRGGADGEAALAEGRDDVRQELEKLAGPWVLVYWLFDGQEQSLAEGRPVLTFEAERFTIRRGGRVIERGYI